LSVVHGVVGGAPPRLDLDRERALIALLTRAASAGLLQSAHDCSDGGIAVTIAESAFDTSGIGVAVDLPRSISTAGTLFGESASRAVISVKPEHLGKLMALAGELGVPAARVGRTGGSSIAIRVDGRSELECSLAEAENIWSNALGKYFAGRAA
jgi:phosphoribosylformylglycinamidine synthase